MQKRCLRCQRTSLLSQKVDEITIFYIRVTMQLMAIQAIIMHLVCLPPVFTDIKSPLKRTMVMGFRIVDSFYCTFSVMYLTHMDTHLFCSLCFNLSGVDALVSKCLCVHKKLGALTKVFSVGLLIRCLFAGVIAEQVSPSSIITYLIELCTLLYSMLIGIVIPIPLGIKMLYFLLSQFPMTILSYNLSGNLVIVPTLIATILLVSLISYYFVSFSRKKSFFSIETTRNMVTILGGQIMNLFLNALPSRLVPNVMSGVRMEPTVCLDVCFSYIAVSDAVPSNPGCLVVNAKNADYQKIDEYTKGFMSRLNLYYCLLDFLSECIGVQKIKSTYTLYMVAAGLESILDINYKGPVSGYLLGQDDDQEPQAEQLLLQTDPLAYKLRAEKLKFKQIATFCLAARIAGESLGFNVSAGITKGPIITGMLGQGQANCNFDVWGDVVNMAARIARGFNSGVFIKQDDFYSQLDDSISGSYCRAAISESSLDDDYSVIALKNDLEKKRQDVSKYLPSEDIVRRSREIVYNLPPCYMFGMSFPRMYKGKAGVTWITELVETDYMPWLLRRTFSLAYRNLLLSYISEDSQQTLGLPANPASPRHRVGQSIKQGANTAEAKQLVGMELFEAIKRNLGLEKDDNSHIDNALAVVRQRDQLDALLLELKMYVCDESKNASKSSVVPIKDDHLKILKSLSTLATLESSSATTKPYSTQSPCKDPATSSSFLSDNSLRRVIYCVYSGDYSLLEHGGEFIDLRIYFGLTNFLSHVNLRNEPMFSGKHPIMARLQFPASANQLNILEPRSDSSDDLFDGITNSQLMIETIYKATNVMVDSQFHKSHVSSSIADSSQQRGEDKYRNTSLTLPSSSQDLHSTIRQSTDGISGSAIKSKGRYRKPNNLQISPLPDSAPNAVEEYFFVQPDIKPLALSSFNTSSLRIPETILTPRVLTNQPRHDFHDVVKLGVEKTLRKTARNVLKGQKSFSRTGSNGLLRIEEDSREVEGSLGGQRSEILQLHDLGLTKRGASVSRETSGDDTEYSLASITRRYASGESIELQPTVEYTKSKLGKQTVAVEKSASEEVGYGDVQHFKDFTLMDLPHQSGFTTFDDQLEDNTLQSTLRSFDKMNYSFKDLLPPIQAPSDNMKALRNKTEASHENSCPALVPIRPLIEADTESDNISVSNDDIHLTAAQGLSLATPTAGDQRGSPLPHFSSTTGTRPLARSNSQLHWQSEDNAKTAPAFCSRADSTDSIEPTHHQFSDAARFSISKPALQKSTGSIKGDSFASSLLQCKQTGKIQQRASSLSRTPQQQPHRIYSQRSTSVSAEQRVQNFFTFFNTSATATPTPTKVDAVKNALILDYTQLESMTAPQNGGRHGRSVSFLARPKSSCQSRDNQSTGSSRPLSTLTMQRSQSTLESWNDPTRGTVYSKTPDFTEQDASFDPSTTCSRNNLVAQELCIDKPENDECFQFEDCDRTSTSITVCTNGYNDRQVCAYPLSQERIPVGLLSFQILFGVLLHMRRQIELLCSISNLISKRCTEEIGFAFMVTGMMRSQNYCIDFFVILFMYITFSIILRVTKFNTMAVIFFFNSKVYFSSIKFIYWTMLGINILWQISFSIYLRYYDGVRRAVKIDFDKATERGENSDNLGRDLLFNNVVIGVRILVTLTTVVCIYLIQCFYSIGFYSALNNSINEEPDAMALLIFFMLPFQFFYVVTILSTTSNSVFFISYNFIALMVATLVLVIASFCGQIEAVLVNLIMLIAACIYSSTKLRIRISILDWKASVANQIKTYKERLNPILPGMTIDVMIAAKQPEAISSTEGVFQFIECYMRDLNHMICLAELEKASQIHRVGSTPITDAPHSRVPPIDFFALKLERDLLPNTSPFISSDAAHDPDEPGLIVETGQKNKHYWEDFCQQARETIESRSKELYKGFVYNMHQYLHFSDPRYLSYDRPIVYFARVGYLSLDIVNFTKLSSEHDAKSILRFLGDLFSEFDKRIDRAPQLKQIKSIGDAYEVMGLPGILKKYGNAGKRRNKDSYGQKEDDRILQLYDGLLLLVMAGFGFIEDCIDVSRKHFSDKVDYLGLRVGVCTGVAFGSLLGSKQFRFDVFGNVPEEADLIQSEASINAIFISSDVKKILEEGESKWKSRFHEYQVEQEALGVQALDIQHEHLSFTFVKHVKDSVTMYEVQSINESQKLDHLYFLSKPLDLS
ncbi:Nucleotidyl cyclase [Giardia duodenalis]|uniref:adenylate cyclase n=1 Tax=Giardia intestinalis (strain ATCC 50803 / WB clone C6) TaxID=184922 RepID=A8B947_GIAIC|nr:Nucleotidyl cyclase [Giardia intestinalis]KAE8302330.1 Nucleotidyl cyclase [Giardia intestinalis]|eukprot:XP_001708765.1 Hypothetical protein GL50803_16599 [Giardia lamblia ATCC 50803]